jgi:hypothetical protein
LALDPSEIIKYFTRKERYPSLAAWSFKLEQLYREFLTLRILVVESIDIKDNPALSFQEVQKNLYKQLGISIEVAEGAESKSSVKVTFNKENMIIDGLTPTVSNLMKQAVREEKITDPSSLTELAQLHYFNKIYKHRYMGFSPELLIYDAFRHWDWAAGIANLCNSILPIFEKLVKKEVYVFPFLDKDLQECIPRGTLVYLGNSVIDIADLSPVNRGKKHVALTHKGFGHITQWFSRDYNGKMLELNFYYTNIPLKITPDHPLLVMRDGRYTGNKRGKKLNHFNESELKWIKASEIVESDFMAFPRIKQTVDLNIISNELAELIGWYISEGCPQRRNEVDSDSGVVFSLGKHEKEHIEHISTLIQACFGHKPSYSESENCCRIYLYNSAFASLFHQFGESAHTKRIPRWLLFLPMDKQIRFLRGLIGGDGNKYKDQKKASFAISYFTVSQQLAFQLRLILFRLGILHGLFKRRRKTNLHGQQRIEEGYVITIHGNFARALWQAFGFPSQNDDLIPREKTYVGVVSENYVFIPLGSKSESDYVGKVYNLHVSPDESYVTVHGTLHNCTSACNSFLTFLQTQSQSIRTEDLSLEGPSDENPKGDPYIGQTVKPNTPSNPNGGILTPVGSHILLGDAMIETTAAENNIMRLDLPPDYDQPSWTVAKVYVRPGEKLLENMKVVTISAMNIRAEQGRFFKLFQDVHRQLSKIRDKAIYLKEAIEEESRGGAPTPEGEGTGFHPKGHRFESAESAVSDEEVKETSESLGIPEKDTGQLMKKISRAKKKAARSRE